MMSFNNIVVVGPTSAIAYEVLKGIVNKSTKSVALIGRNKAKLEAIAHDLKVRSSCTIDSIVCDDFTDPVAIKNVIQKIHTNPIDLVFIAQGILLDQSECEKSLSLQYKSMLINAVSPLLFLEGFAKKLEMQNSGTIAICGSVAGDRPRMSNYCYGASKSFIDQYASGLMHRLSRTNVRVCVIKPGPTHTPMTRGMVNPQVRLSDVKIVASQIIRGLNDGAHVIYAPNYWKYIMLVIKLIPRSLFLKLKI